MLDVHRVNSTAQIKTFFRIVFGYDNKIRIVALNRTDQINKELYLKANLLDRKLHVTAAEEKQVAAERRHGGVGAGVFNLLVVQLKSLSMYWSMLMA